MKLVKLEFTLLIILMLCQGIAALYGWLAG
jgi:hypothetical protein